MSCKAQQMATVLRMPTQWVGCRVAYCSCGSAYILTQLGSTEHWHSESSTKPRTQCRRLHVVALWICMPSKVESLTYCTRKLLALQRYKFRGLAPGRCSSASDLASAEKALRPRSVLRASSASAPVLSIPPE
eukprot:3764754-Amphidinium_carterae.1